MTNCLRPAPTDTSESSSDIPLWPALGLILLMIVGIGIMRRESMRRRHVSRPAG
jgi:hypothetical protein